MIQSQLRFDDFFEGENAPPHTHTHTPTCKQLRENMLEITIHVKIHHSYIRLFMCVSDSSLF